MSFVVTRDDWITLVQRTDALEALIALLVWDPSSTSGLSAAATDGTSSSATIKLPNGLFLCYGADIATGSNTITISGVTTILDVMITPNQDVSAERLEVASLTDNTFLMKTDGSNINFQWFALAK